MDIHNAGDNYKQHLDARHFITASSPAEIAQAIDLLLIDEIVGVTMLLEEEELTPEVFDLGRVLWRIIIEHHGEGSEDQQMKAWKVMRHLDSYGFYQRLSYLVHTVQDLYSGPLAPKMPASVKSIISKAIDVYCEFAACTRPTNLPLSREDLLRQFRDRDEARFIADIVSEASARALREINADNWR